MLSPGDPAPWFSARSTALPNHVFDQGAGYYSVLCFFGSASDPAARQVLADLDRDAARFEQLNAAFYGVSVDPEDERSGRVRQLGPRIMHFWDFDRAVSRLYGAAPEGGAPCRPHTLVLDAALRVRAVIPFDQDMPTHLARALAAVSALPPLGTRTDFAPVLTLPLVFERELCRTLIGLYDRHGGQEMGTLTDVAGRTVRVNDRRMKSRADYVLDDPAVLEAARARLQRRVVPEIKKAFQFHVTHIERYIVGCYDASTGGHFRPHRDDNTRGSAHRRFAVSINLNAEEYEGGDLVFPEFSNRAYRAPSGGAVVFSCTFMHGVTPLRKGRRYAFLPFMYDDEAARLREANQQFVSEDLRAAGEKLNATTL